MHSSDDHKIAQCEKYSCDLHNEIPNANELMSNPIPINPQKIRAKKPSHKHGHSSLLRI